MTFDPPADAEPVATAPATAPDEDAMHAMSIARDRADTGHGTWYRIATPVPMPGPGEVLVRVLAAGFGHWDVLERDGRLGAAALSTGPVIGGSEGAGSVVEVGPGVHRVREGDRVCAIAPPGHRRNGFHAQFALVSADLVWPVPVRLPLHQAAALPVDGGLALHAIDRALDLGRGQSLLISGASGGIGHMALQFARHRGARVLAVASGADGVDLAERLGADMAIDGRRHDVTAALRIFAPGGLDAALLTADAPSITGAALRALRPGGRIAWPQGVLPPADRSDVAALAFGAREGMAQVRAACRAIARGPFEVHVGARFPLQRIDDAAHALAAHHLGRIVLEVL
ncbi:NADP-dependent oxidoreductase [Luteimonas deserti]|nr:NADP-dependent oxidoreductase [Luteimonas deserti]